MFSHFCAWVLRICGWRLDVHFPEHDKFVLIVAPHTSNWDFPLGILAARALRLEANYLGKHTLFEGPFGWLFRKLGGIPVDRGQARNLSQQMAERFAQADRMVLALAPEGTRRRAEFWKMGFWHIARAARVPIVMVYFDYPNRLIGGGQWFLPGDDLEADLEIIRMFYRDRSGRHPEQQGPIRARPRPAEPGEDSP